MPTSRPGALRANASLCSIDRDFSNVESQERIDTMPKQTEHAKHLAYHYVHQLSDWAKVETRPLFGAVALYRNDHVFAMAWQGSLYFKVDEVSRGDYEAANSHALSYVSKGKDQALKSYWEVPADVLEDADKLHAWAERAYQSALENEKS